MKISKLFISALLILLFNYGVFGQSISISVPTEINVCEEFEIIITVNNQGGPSIDIPIFTLELPCNMTYQDNSLTNGTLKDATDSSKPIFEFNPISANSTVSIRMNIQTNCGAYECLNKLENPQLNAELARNDTVVKSSSTTMNINAPNLVISNIDKTFEEIPSYGTFQRIFTINNTRTGRVSEFILHHNFAPHFIISTNKGRVINSTNTKHSIVFGAEDFITIGNGDAYFDPGEVLVVRENIRLLSCQHDVSHVRSDYELAWGCEQVVCHSTKAIAQIRVINSQDRGAKLTSTVSQEPALCFDNNNVRQSININKISHLNALTDIKIEIFTQQFNRGILLNSIKTDWPFKINYIDVSENTCGQKIAKRAILTLERIEPTSITSRDTIIWDIGLCEMTDCETKQIAYNYSIEYRKECAASNDSYYSSNVNIGSPLINDLRILALLNRTEYRDNQMGILNIYLQDLRLTNQNTDSLKLKINMSKAISIDNNFDFIMNNVSPHYVNKKENNGNITYTIGYPMPFPNDNFVLSIPFVFRCDDFNADNIDTSKPYASCACLSLRDTVNVTAEIISNNNCAESYRPFGCSSYDYAIDCPNIGYPSLDTLATALGYSATVSRISFDPQDKNNNGRVDESQTEDFRNFDLLRYLPGDTILISISGRIIHDKLFQKPRNLFLGIIPIAYFSESVEDNKIFEDILFKDDAAFKTIKSNLKFKPKNGSETLELNNIPFRPQFVNEIFNLSADSLFNYNEYFDEDFYFKDGDSVRLDIYKVIDIKPFEDGKSDLRFRQFFEFILNIYSYLGNDIPEKLDRTSCDCFTETITFPEHLFNTPAGFISTNYQNTTICIDDFIERNLFSFNLGYFLRNEIPNQQPVFINEVRPIVQIKEVQFPLNNNVELGNLSISYGDSVFIFEPSIIADKIIYKTEDIIPWSGHANRFSYLFNYGLKPKGCINKVLPGILDMDVLLNKTRVGELYYPEKISSRIQYQFANATLKSLVLEPELTAFSETFNAQFDLFYNDNIQSINNVYVKISNESNTPGNFSLKDVSSNRIYTDVNGFFNLGSLRRNISRRFEINGLLNSCDSEKLYIEYGFDCDDVTDIASEPCFKAIDSILINFPKGQIDIVPAISQNDNLALCDTSNQKITVINAGLGRAYDNIITLDIPAGIDYVPHSGKLFYPSGQTQNFQLLPDPMFNGNDIFTWSMKEIWAAHENGLNGSSQAPENTYDITYDVVTNCDVLSGSTLTYKISSQDYCGDNLNNVSKVGQKIILPDLTSPNSISILSQSDGFTECNKRSAKIQYTFSSSSDVPMTFIVRLPLGLTFVAQSVVTNLTDSSITINSNSLQWNILPTDRQVDISFVIANTHGDRCDDFIIQSFIVQSASAICANTGKECDISASLGNNQIILSQDIFDIDITDINISHSELDLNLSFNLEVLSGQGKLPLEFLLFVDKNENGLLDASDIIMDTLYSNSFEPPTQFRLNNELDIEDICSLFLVMKGETNCLCSDKYYPIGRNTSIKSSRFTLCSGDLLELGTEAKAGFSYQWNSNVGMSCTQCPKAIISLENTTNDVINTVRILELKNDNSCLIKLEFPITIPPQLKINVKNLDICQGDTIRVLSSFGSEYLWQGPEILSNNSQELVATPLNDANYTLNVRDVYGCEYMDSFFVNVFNKPTLNILHNLPFCSDSTARLDVILNDATDFFWNGRNFLDNPTSLTSSFVAYEDRILRLEAFNGSCREIFDVPIQFIPPQNSRESATICDGETFIFNDIVIDKAGEYCQNLISSFGCDSLSCIDITITRPPENSSWPTLLFKSQLEDLTISGFNGFSSYKWTPSLYLDCDTCATPTTTTPDTITYIVEIVDDFGCTIVHRVFIDISEKCNIDNIVFPNGFSPNGDGVNDKFALIFDVLCGAMDITIYNRWGNIVYQTTEWDNSWDGRSNNGEILPQGTYFYDIRFKVLNESVSGMIDLRVK